MPIDKLFPLDVDLAFKKLDEIKKDVSVWWKAGAQPPQLLKDNEVQYSICWSGRVVNEPAFAMNFAGGKADLSYFGIVKGSKPEDKAAAYKLMHEMSLPENQAKAAEVISYTGPSPELDTLLPKDKLWQFPTSKQNKEVQYFENAEWWVDERRGREQEVGSLQAQPLSSERHRCADRGFGLHRTASGADGRRLQRAHRLHAGPRLLGQRARLHARAL